MGRDENPNDMTTQTRISYGLLRSYDSGFLHIYSP
jgi:hypothetical protein